MVQYPDSSRPDGRALAAVAWHDAVQHKEECSDEGEGRECRSHYAQEPRLHLVDLESWTEQVVPVGTEEPHLLTYSADGKSLLCVKIDSSPKSPRTNILYRYDLAARTSRLVAELPSGFNPKEMRLLLSGERLAVYGAPQQKVWERVTFQVLLIDLQEGRTVTDVPLDGLTDGFVQLEDAPSLGIMHFQAGMAWDLDRNRLFIVHPDEDRVTVVDLNEGKLVKQSEIHQGQSLLNRLLNWVVRPAYAKAWPAGERRVALSSDGKLLYITGTEGEWDEGADRIVVRPVGTRVVFTEDMRELRRLDLPVSDLALSPNGERLLLGSTLQGNSDYPTSGLYVLETKSLRELTHLESELNFRLHGFSSDRGYAYMSSRMTQANGEVRAVVKTLDLESLEFIGERPLGPFALNESLVGILRRGLLQTEKLVYLE